MPPTLRKLARGTAFAVGGFVLLVVALRAGTGFLEWRAQRWCEDLVPRLEAWRAVNGHYPDSLDALGEIDGTPILCRPRDHAYDPRHGEFILDISSGPMSGKAFTSRDGRWHRY